MTVQVNIQPIFETDDAGRLVEKLNINFNKLLELGIGDTGPQGPAGIQGPIGPIGPIGDTGRRGSLWFADNGTPNGSPDLGDFDIKTGDLYIDIDNGDFYQFDGSPGSWDKIGPVLSNVITNVVQNLGLSVNTFLRDFYTQISPSSDDAERFLVMKNRNQSGTTTDEGDILFLSNFDENTINIDPENLYRAINVNYVDTTISAVSRYHNEYGVLYNNGNNDVLTNENQNLKFLLDYDFNSNKIKAIYNLSAPSFYRGNNSGLTINDDSRFEFITTDRANNTNFNTYIGNNQALSSEVSFDVGDGILFQNNTQSLSLGLDDNNSYALLNTDFHTVRTALSDSFIEFVNYNTNESQINFNDTVKLDQVNVTDNGGNDIEVFRINGGSDLKSIYSGSITSSEDVYLGHVDDISGENSFAGLLTKTIIARSDQRLIFEKYTGNGPIESTNEIMSYDSTGLGIGDFSSNNILQALHVRGSNNAIFENQIVIGDTNISSNSDEKVKVVGNVFIDGPVRSLGENYEFDTSLPPVNKEIQIGSISLYGFNAIQADGTGEIFTIYLPSSNSTDIYDGQIIWIKSLGSPGNVDLPSDPNNQGPTQYVIDLDNININGTLNDNGHLLQIDWDSSNGIQVITHKIYKFMFDAYNDQWQLLEDINLPT